MTYTPQQAFMLGLLSPDRPHPGHGVRVNALGSRYYDVQTLTHGSLEDRAQHGKRMLEMDLRGLEIIGDDRVPSLHCWSGTEVFAAAYGSEVHRPENDMPRVLARFSRRTQARARMASSAKPSSRGSKGRSIRSPRRADS